MLTEEEVAFITKTVEFREKMEEKLSLASALLSEAMQLSKEHDLPYSFEISYMRNEYFPSKLEEMKKLLKVTKNWGELNEAIREELGIMDTDSRNIGWQRSSC